MLSSSQSQVLWYSVVIASTRLAGPNTCEREIPFYSTWMRYTFMSEKGNNVSSCVSLAVSHMIVLKMHSARYRPRVDLCHENGPSPESCQLTHCYISNY